MRRRRAGAAACIAVAGTVLSLAPLGAWSAGAKPNHNSPACRAIKREQAGAAAAGFAVEKAMASGNFARAKHQMLHAYAGDLGDLTRTIAAIKAAPPNVRAAFKDLRTDIVRIRAAIKGATSLAQLEAELQSLGRDPQLQADGTTIAKWADSVCGTSVPSTSGGG